MLRRKNFDYRTVDAFDLTPAMLARFDQKLQARGSEGVQLRQADVLVPDDLPSSWNNYDLILSASMLEYLSKQDFPRALGELRARLAPDGLLVVLISRKTIETKFLIEKCWHAERYTREEIRDACVQARLCDPEFRKFPTRYFWLNRANLIAVASCGD